ncbi:putative ABC transporter ATP-binding protein [Diplodia seriata]|uniref:Putative ABC transporter ATP-binding protein n=1 Tax=Diplodia seriata TaxID=420778 RepID=A0A1S8BFE3_9PEZI|nr:putative ABC transporter ATP-binding protein [Diplodia seriata]
MRFFSARRVSPAALRQYATRAHSPLIRIENATFYRNNPTPGDESSNPPLYPDLNFTLPAESDPSQHWAVLSTSSANRTAFLQILRGQHLSIPHTARSYPYLLTDEITKKDPRLRNPHNAIQYVGFDAERGGLPGGASTKGAYMSARYESLREVTDWSVRDYLLGNTELNADESLTAKPPPDMVERVMRDLNLDALQHMAVSRLSNGQTRRARIAKALLARPELLLLDGPFMGLDPHTLQYLSGLLHRMAEARQPRLLLSLRPYDVIPDWITHFVVVGHRPKVSVAGDRKEMFEFLREHYMRTNETDIEFRTPYFKLDPNPPDWGGVYHGERVVDVLDEEMDDMLALYEIARTMEAKGDFDGISQDPARAAKMRVQLKRPRKGLIENLSKDGLPLSDVSHFPLGEPLIEMKGVQIKYNDSDTPVLGNWQGGLFWEVRRGHRWGVFGPNGSGKTTLLSLITSDHPQTYSAPVKLFGRSRLPTPGEPGISIFEIQSRIGHSSPEVHTYFPKHLTIRRVLESAWADTPLSKPRLTYEADEKVNACLRWFRNELCPDQGDTLDQRGEAFTWGRMSKAQVNPPRYLEITATTLRDEEALMHEALDWADTTRFGELSFSAQRVALFLRAIVKAPDLVVLDEAFSGMDELARDKCMLFLHHGESMTLRYLLRDRPRLRAQGARPFESSIGRIGRVRVPGLAPHQALVVVAHARDEVPGCVREFLTLPEPSSSHSSPSSSPSSSKSKSNKDDRPAPRTGILDGPMSHDARRWGRVWGVQYSVGRQNRKAPPDDRKEAILGAGSPMDVYSNGLNIYTDTYGLPHASEAAKERRRKEREMAGEDGEEEEEEKPKRGRPAKKK